MPPPSRGSARGGRGAAASGKLKFQPKSNVRRSQAEREKDEKKEQAAIRAEEAAIERERKRQEERAARRGRGAMRARGGARGGVSGWMAAGVEPDTGHLSGAVTSDRYSGSGSGYGGGGGGGGGSGGRHTGEFASADGSGRGASSGRRQQDDGFKSGSVVSRTNEEHFQRDDGTRMRMVNIEDIHTINISSDEDEVADDAPKNQTKTRPVRRGLAPVRVARHEHIPRKAKVNIDLTTMSPADREKAKDMASTSTEMHDDMADKPIKIEDDEEPAPKIKQEGLPKAKRKPVRRQKKPETVVLDEESEEEEEGAEQATKPKPSLPANAQPLTDLLSIPALPRPKYVRDDCNFVALPRPPGWSSKEDTENWDRNIRSMYAVYEELSFPEKMKKEIPSSSGTIDTDVKMQDAETTEKGKDKEDTTDESKLDRKQDLVYMFKLPPRWPGIEDMVNKEEYEKAKRKAGRDADGTDKADENGNNDNDDLIAIDPPASPKIKRSRSPETPRKSKGKGKGAEPKIKEEGASQRVAVKSEPKDEKDAANAPSASASSSAAAITAGDGKKPRLPGSGKPGYIGDLVIYSTGEARLDWGGLHLTLEMGRQTSMLQQVLLTDVPVHATGDAHSSSSSAAAAAAAAKKGRGRAAVADADGAKIKREPGAAGAGAGASAGTALRVNNDDDDDDDDGNDGDDDNGDGGGGGGGDDDGRDAVSGAPVAPMSAAAIELDRAYAMGSVAGSFTAIPDFSAILGKK